MPVVVNVVNFMDGINGITALTMLVWGATALLVGAVHGGPELAVIGAATAGAALGFLPWNAPHARLFLGDVGSYLFGALAAGGVLLAATGQAPVSLILAPLMIFGADTAVTLVKRAIRRAPLTVAHREHTYQRLVHLRRWAHAPVALWAGSASALITVAWATLNTIGSCIATTCTLLIYLMSDRILHNRKRNSHGRELADAA